MSLRFSCWAIWQMQSRRGFGRGEDCHELDSSGSRNHVVGSGTFGVFQWTDHVCKYVQSAQWSTQEWGLQSRVPSAQPVCQKRKKRTITWPEIRCGRTKRKSSLLGEQSRSKFPSRWIASASAQKSSKISWLQQEVRFSQRKDHAVPVLQASTARLRSPPPRFHAKKGVAEAFGTGGPPADILDFEWGFLFSYLFAIFHRFIFFFSFRSSTALHHMFLFCFLTVHTHFFFMKPFCPSPK